MLELIFRGFLEWTYGLVLESWEYFASTVFDVIHMDFDTLRTFVPVIDPIWQGMLALGWALLIGNLVFQAAKAMMAGLGFEGEDPKLLFARTFVFSFLLLASPQICQVCLDMTAAMMDVMDLPEAVEIRFSEASLFSGLDCAWLLILISNVIVMFQCFRLIIELAERYVILAMLTLCAPLAFGTGGSRNTSDIFAGWCRMYGAMCLLLVLQVVFVKMIFSIVSYCPTRVDFLPWIVLLLTVVKVAKKADAIVTRIGLNPAITGDTLGRPIPGALTYMVIRNLSAQMGKAFRQPNRGPGGAPFQGAGAWSAGPSAVGSMPAFSAAVSSPARIGGPPDGSQRGETAYAEQTTGGHSSQRSSSYGSKSTRTANKEARKTSQTEPQAPGGSWGRRGAPVGSPSEERTVGTKAYAGTQFARPAAGESGKAPTDTRKPRDAGAVSADAVRRRGADRRDLAGNVRPAGSQEGRKVPEVMRNGKAVAMERDTVEVRPERFHQVPPERMRRDSAAGEGHSLRNPSGKGGTAVSRQQEYRKTSDMEWTENTRTQPHITGLGTAGTVPGSQAKELRMGPAAVSGTHTEMGAGHRSPAPRPLTQSPVSRREPPAHRKGGRPE